MWTYVIAFTLAAPKPAAASVAAPAAPSVPKQKPAPQIKDEGSEDEEDEDDKAPPAAENANILAMRARYVYWVFSLRWQFIIVVIMQIGTNSIREGK